ncbi:hypothetical protein E8F20_11585 [Pseudomonas sp. BN415]|uniref:hypothetical protein n=1 Tax=Pseudomonas sp. BN415 TaxID=2567889 RepID=UPI0024559BD8|nr:hypothetical protein [Pseudomonas sp. BN415]MDH4582508.1 hypothetical protein [Pseudomonas sp. BN415]
MKSILALCSRHFTYEHLFNCGETWQKYRPENSPKQQSSWEAYSMLAKNILDPLVDHFGMPLLTFGFCGPELIKEIKKKRYPGIAPNIDQHTACELSKNGKLICSRKGAAVDLVYSSVSSLDVAQWLVKNTKFDRIYLYGEKCPLHVSYGPGHTRQVVMIHISNGRRIPKVISTEVIEGLKNC